MIFNDKTLIPSSVKTDQQIQIWKGSTNTHTYNIHILKYSETNVMHFSFNLLRINRKSYALITMYIRTFKYLLISARNIPSNVCEAPPEDEQVMLETCTDP
jgi:hypothetical protein